MTKQKSQNPLGLRVLALNHMISLYGDGGLKTENMKRAEIPVFSMVFLHLF